MLRPSERLFQVSQTRCLCVSGNVGDPHEEGQLCQKATSPSESMFSMSRFANKLTSQGLGWHRVNRHQGEEVEAVGEQKWERASMDVSQAGFPE